MTTISLRIPDSLPKVVRDPVKKEGISIDQFVTLALVEKVSALATQAYLEERATRRDKTKFLAAMQNVANVEPPDERDRL